MNKSVEGIFIKFEEDPKEFKSSILILTCIFFSCLFSVKYERIKFLVIALKSSVEVYAWAPKPYHKFMAFKVIMSSALRSSMSHATVTKNHEQLKLTI